MCACVAESFRQIRSATTVPPVVESPPGWHCGWLAAPCVSGRERERAREHYFHLAHTSSCSPHTPVTLTLPFCPMFVASMEGASLTLSLLSLSLFIIIALTHLMILPNEVCCFSWTPSRSCRLFVVWTLEDRKRFPAQEVVPWPGVAQVPTCAVLQRSERLVVFLVVYH